MSLQTVLTRRLGLAHPIIQAPLAGGGDTPELVAAVVEAGALGFIGAAYLTPAQIVEAARAVGARTKRPFGINLFAPLPAPEAPPDLRPALERVAPFYTELGLAPPEVPASPRGAFDEQFAAALASGASAFSFTFGMLPAGAREAVKARRMFLIGTATTVDEALALEKAGVDAIVTQGSEAGGHRGTFGGDFEAAMVGTMALVPQVVDAVGVPVIASGGIMDGRGIAAALALGAEGVQLGTAFLAAEEAGTPEAYRTLVAEAGEEATAITRAYTGRHARAVRTRLIEHLESAGAEILPFPVQGALLLDIRQAATEQGVGDLLFLLAGQASGLSRRLPAGELVETLARETEAVLAGLTAVS